jgi:ABC-type branched-subunit amino acid transport system ATPase component/ABC-type branched-subunit amino acid transport system permease subunit
MLGTGELVSPVPSWAKHRFTLPQERRLIATVIQYAVLGFGVGALYSLASQGLILIYRGSGVLNFAQGGIGIVGAYVWYELNVNQHWPYVPALIAGIGAAALLGALVQIVIMRRLRHASGLARVVATLGVLITIQGVVTLKYGTTVINIGSALPVSSLKVAGVSLPSDRLILFGVAAVLTVALTLAYRFTKFGRATAAVAENQQAAATLGLSPESISVANWALGSALAGLAAILIVPIVSLQLTEIDQLVIAAMSAALVARFSSFSVAFFAALVIGVAQSELIRYAPSVTGLSSSIPFIVIVLVLVLRGQALPLRDFLIQRLPSVGSGRIRLPLVFAAAGAGVLLVALTNGAWTTAIGATFPVAIILLSIVVLTGYAGQISLAQYALAGFGAWVAGRLFATAGLGFIPAALCGVAATIPVGVIFALPAVRTRGINLAIMTLGLGSAIELMIFDNGNFTGGSSFTAVTNPSLFGWSIQAETHPARYAYVGLACFVGCALLVANLRRGRNGRRMVAVRTNERAASALGIHVPAVKLYAFGVSAGIAALGGILVAFVSIIIDYTQFTSFTSITYVGLSFVGGIGFVVGPLLGAMLSPGSLGAQIGTTIFSNFANYLQILAGVSVIVIVLQNQNGQVELLMEQGRWLARRLHVPRRKPRERVLPEPRQTRLPPKSLTVNDLSVTYGTVKAVDGVSVQLEPGRVLGLIGPNGAGKTTFVDAVTGFTKPTNGTLLLDGEDISDWSVARRAQVGISRSFQSLELFDDLTVLENLQTAADKSSGRPRLFSDLIYPRTIPLPGEVVAAVHEFGLTDELDRLAADLPYGQRRLLAIARAVAIQPSVLLLDEPAAGLSQVESRELETLVRRLADDWGMAVLLIEHNVDFVMRVCDELHVIDFGRTISTGAPDEVRRDPAVVAAYLGEPVSAVEAGPDDPITIPLPS